MLFLMLKNCNNLTDPDDPECQSVTGNTSHSYNLWPAQSSDNGGCGYSVSRLMSIVWPPFWIHMVSSAYKFRRK